MCRVIYNIKWAIFVFSRAIFNLAKQLGLLEENNLNFIGDGPS